MKYTFIILLTLSLSGCVTGNYQSFSSGVGYQSEQKDGDEYHVTYTGTAKTKIEKVNDFTLLRSAVLTLEKGYNYFVITEAKNNKVELEAIQTRQALPSPDRDLGALGQMTRNLSAPKPKSELTIVLFNKKPEGITYEARKIEKAIKEEYNILDQPS